MLVCVLAVPAFAQNAEASYYVNAAGNDNNNGLTENTPLRSLSAALSKARNGSIKRITILGVLANDSAYTANSISSMNSVFTCLKDPKAPETQEITITGKINASSETSNAVLSGGEYDAAVLLVQGMAIRLEHIEITGGRGSEGIEGAGIVILDGASVILGAGAVVHHNAAAGISILNGSCVIEGGDIRDNQQGGVQVSEHCSLTMNSGYIRNNKTANNAGGVYVMAEGYFSMTGGIILGNRADIYGGGVYVRAGGVFDQTGGTISGNYAVAGANIYRQSGI